MKKIFRGKLQDLAGCYLPDVVIEVKNLNKSYDIGLEIVIFSEK